MAKKIKLPNKKVQELFKFLKDNNLKEYEHSIKNISISEPPLKKPKYNYSLEIKREKPLEFYWAFIIVSGLYIFYKAYKIIEIGMVNNTIGSWEFFFILFGIIGFLMVLSGFLKIIFSWNTKWVHINEDKTKKTPYSSNLEPIKF